MLRNLICGDNFDLKEVYPTLCAVKKELIRHHPTYHFNISDETANFTRFKRGDVLASDLTETYTVEEDGEMIAFPNGKVKIGQRSGLVMKEVNLTELFKK